MNKGDKLKSVSFKIDETKTIKSYDLKGIFQLFISKKDDTPGCKRSIEFSEYYNDFKKIGVTVLGISKDSL